jgi:hypothetical protein
MTNYCTKSWLAMVWSIRPGVLQCIWGMLALKAFKGYLTPQTKATISSINKDLAVT